MSGARQLEQDLEVAASRLALALRGFEDGAEDGEGQGIAAGLAGPERELLAMLDGQAGGFSFAAGDEEGAAQRMLDELLERASTLARVETRGAERRSISTHVGRGGDIVCCVTPDIEAQLLARHVSAVEQAMREQQERTVLLLSTLQMAMKIAVAVGTGNPLLAVPAALRFIRQIRAELSD